jgi:hypothetical protein
MLMAALDGVPVVVDMPAQSARSVSRWIRESGVNEVAAEAGVRVVRWHVMDDGKDSLKLLQWLLSDRLEGVDLVVVRNFGRGSDFSWMTTTPELTAAREAGAIFVDLPALHAPTMSKIDRMDASFWAASQNRDESRGPNLNLLESRRVRVWLQNAHAALMGAHASLRAAAPSTEPATPMLANDPNTTAPTQGQVMDPQTTQTN